MTTTKKIKELAAGEAFKLKEDSKRVWTMGYPSAGFRFKRSYNRSTKKYTCVPDDDVLSGGREFKADKLVFVGFEY